MISSQVTCTSTVHTVHCICCLNDVQVQYTSCLLHVHVQYTTCLFHVLLWVLPQHLGTRLSVHENLSHILNYLRNRKWKKLLLEIQEMFLYLWLKVIEIKMTDKLLVHPGTETRHTDTRTHVKQTHLPYRYTDTRHTDTDSDTRQTQTHVT